jgi:signal transduction histidine kinase
MDARDQHRPWPRPPSFVAELVPTLALATLLLLVSPLEARALNAGHRLEPVALLLLAGAAVSLALRRRLPLAAYAASLLCTAGYLLVSHAPGPVFLAPFIGLVTVIAVSPARVWLTAAVAGASVLALAHGLGSGWSIGTAIFVPVWLLVALAAGVGIRARRRWMQEMSTRMRLAQRNREEESRRRLAEERLRIAREMHDVVGHSLAVISLQSGVAEHLLDSRPDEARKAVTAIRAVSRQALSDLRIELALLRGNGAAPAERTPTPTLRALPQLVMQMRDAGLPVDLETSGDGSGVPDIVASAAYRIAQESLTNVARHAAGARATVRAAVEPQAVEVEVSDDGPGVDGAADGDGIAGMRDRALTLGGSFAAGNRPGGGFRVWARLPWGEAAPR